MTAEEKKQHKAKQLRHRMLSQVPQEYWIQYEGGNMNDIATINRIYKWADQNRIKYQDKYQMDGSPSALKTFERYDDICDICRAAEIGKAEEDETKKHIHSNQMAMIDRLREMQKFAPAKVFSYADVEEWMRKMMV